MSFATQKRKIIREGTPRALKLRWWLFVTLSIQSKKAETFTVFKREY